VARAKETAVVEAATAITGVPVVVAIVVAASRIPAAEAPAPFAALKESCLASR
jgi:hypothetical protein